ncbi:hypothetical protein D3C87_1634770 [compost metagenome]
MEALANRIGRGTRKTVHEGIDTPSERQCVIDIPGGFGAWRAILEFQHADSGLDTVRRLDGGWSVGGRLRRGQHRQHQGKKGREYGDGFEKVRHGCLPGGSLKY